MSNKIKHLEFIQDVINRMARNSFLLKGWFVTIITVLLTISFKEDSNLYVIVILVPVVVFWILDAYYLQQEKLFRNLYDNVSQQKEEQINFSLKTDSQFGSLFSSLCSISTFVFYFGCLIIVLAISLLT